MKSNYRKELEDIIEWLITLIKHLGVTNEQLSKFIIENPIPNNKLSITYDNPITEDVSLNNNQK